jgi:hypothetical protein
MAETLRPATPAARMEDVGPQEAPTRAGAPPVGLWAHLAIGGLFGVVITRG